MATTKKWTINQLFYCTNCVRWTINAKWPNYKEQRALCEQCNDSCLKGGKPVNFEREGSEKQALGVE